jgi:hypothetical protein
MIVTYNTESYPSLRVVSDFIDNIIDGSAGHTFTLTVGVNSQDTIDFVITLNDIDEGNARFDIEASDLNLTEFISGVYSFKFKKVNDTTGSTEFESYCLFLDIDFTCDVIDNIAGMLTDTDEVIYTIGIFNLLKNIHQCEECACSNALALWNEINYRLGLTEKTNDCGCN